MKYNPFNKKLSELTEEDLAILIESEVTEGWYIEYKSAIPVANTNSEKLDNLKISKSISSFANTKGGWIFWGISCNSKNNPIELNGINIEGFKNFEDQISQIINSNINPNPFYQFKSIYLKNGNIVFVIQIEESPTPPYITSQGIIFQRENNESKPIKERYIIEKLNEKTNEYYNSIEQFSTFNLPQTTGQSNWNQTFLELYLFPLPFNSFKFNNFYETDFFKQVAFRFYQNHTINFDENDPESNVSLNLGFNSVFSSSESIIVRPLSENNLIYKATTLELFENGNLKFLIPLNEFSTENIPRKYNKSKTIEYLLDKYSPNETVSQSLMMNRLSKTPYSSLPTITRRKKTDFVNHIKFIDGVELISTILILVSKYEAILKDYNFKMDSEIGFRAKVTDCWRKFVFFDDEEYLEKLKLYNIPLSPKNKIEIPIFKNGNSYKTNLSLGGSYLQIARFILEGIGLPDADSIDFLNIIIKDFEFRNKDQAN